MLTYGYDVCTRTHVTSVADSFTYRSSSTINLDFGLPQTTTDSNSKTVTYQYDAFGRQTHVWGSTDPTSGSATIQMDYSAGGAAAATPWARTRHKDIQSTTNDTIDTVTFIDGLGRVVQTKKETELRTAAGGTQAGWSVSGLVVFDSRGRLAQQHQPFFDAANPATTMVPSGGGNPTLFARDPLGRALAVLAPDGALTQSRFFASSAVPEDDLADGQFAGTAVTDPLGNVHREYRDERGRIRAVKDFNMIRGTRKALITRYTYDAFGNVRTVTDALGNVTTATYDSLDRMVALSSLDTGETRFRYSLAGLLAEKQPAALRPANQWIRYVYDFNLLRRIDYPQLADVVYNYGQTNDTGDVAANRLGRIKSVTMEGGTETRSYDAFGNVNQAVTTLNHIDAALPAPTTTMKYQYDWLGRMQNMTFPRTINASWSVPSGDGEVVRYVYDKGGQLDKITGQMTPTTPVENYVSDIGYDEFGQRTALLSGNGIANIYTYDPLSRRLKTNSATANTANGARQFHALTYGYDLAGNVTSLTNTPPQAHIQPDNVAVGVGPFTAGYGYDNLHQITSSTNNYRGHATYGNRHTTTFEYDEIGNLLRKSQADIKTLFNASDVGLANARDNGSVPGTTYTLAYTYPPARPHGATTLTETSSSGVTANRTVRFDANGNNTGDTIGAVTRVLAWDEENRLKQVDLAGSVKGKFRYSAEGERTQKKDAGGGTTFYVNQFLVIHANRNVTKHLYAGETRVLSKTESTSLPTPVKHYYHPDHLGSTAYITDATQNFVQHERYFPFGERWADPTREERTGSIRRDWLFTSKELDTDTGYYYFGARYFDPRASVWQSTDPILRDYFMRGAPELSAGNLGLYTYSWNRPLALIDPDGRQVQYPDLQKTAAAEIGRSIQTLAQDLGRLVDDFKSGFNEASSGQVPQQANVTSPFVKTIGFTAGLAAVFAGRGKGKATAATRGARAPNLSPPGAGRQGAFNEAKRASGVPTSQQPARTLPNTDLRGNVQPGRVYEYEVSASGGGIRTVRIRDDAAGHRFPDNSSQNRGPHFNDPAGQHYEY